MINFTTWQNFGSKFKINDMRSNNDETVNCAGCTTYPCYKGEDCIRGQNFDKYREAIAKEYEKPENKKILEASSHIEVEHYMQWNRLEEIIGFAKQMGYKKIGIAHCVGLINEAKVLKDILEQSFTVCSICCKFSGTSKKEYGLTQIRENNFETMCNPVGQAIVLNELKTDLNLIVGLCIGHDILFTQNSKAPVTTFIVKDRITGHNPAAIIYSNYSKRKLISK